MGGLSLKLHLRFNEKSLLRLLDCIYFIVFFSDENETGDSVSVSHGKEGRTECVVLERERRERRESQRDVCKYFLGIRK